MFNGLMLNGVGIHVCPECNGISEAQSSTQPDNALDIQLSGGYGMFIDDYDTEFAETLCHDCVVKLARLFPNTVGKYLQKAHPFNGERCCEFTWTFDD